jgi:LPXTG-motif cell wall-anchored protein
MLRRAVVSAACAGVFLLLAATPSLAAEVLLTDAGLDPAEVTVDVGESIVWTNTSAQEVVLTSDDPMWTSGPLAPGESFSLTYDEPGTFSYASDDGAIQGHIVVGGEGSNPFEPAGEGDRRPSVAGPAELPATGTNGDLVVLAFGLIASGSAFVSAGRPRLQRR